MIEHINEELAPIEKGVAGLRSLPGRLSGAAMAHYGVGELTSVALLSELGDTRRFSSSKKAVRYAGMDITVHSSDDRRAAGKLSRQGPPVLRWAEHSRWRREPGEKPRPITSTTYRTRNALLGLIGQLYPSRAS